MTAQNQVTIKAYTGRVFEAMKLYQDDADKMTAQGYFPVLQSWVPGEWTGGHFVRALLLCFLVIGFIILIYMLLVKPAGTMSVTYELRK